MRFTKDFGILMPAPTTLKELKNKIKIPPHKSKWQGCCVILNHHKSKILDLKNKYLLGIAKDLNLGIIICKF